MGAAGIERKGRGSGGMDSRGGVGIGSGETDLVTIRIEKGFKVDDVGMRHQSHDLQFTVLGGEGGIRRAEKNKEGKRVASGLGYMP